MSVDTIAARPAFAEEPLGGTVAERLARLPQIVADLQRADAAAERERVLQYDAVQRLRHAGILSLRVPARYGGPGGSVRDVLGAVIQIARGSSNVAQALRPHFGFAERLLSNRATEVERVHWFPRFTEGLVFGNAITDGHGRSPSSAQTRVIADADGVLRLNGYKFYSTGTLFADLIAVSAVDADGLDVQVIVPADREGVELYDDWDGFGQRATASGGTRFTDVVVHPFEVTTVSDGKHLGHGTTFLQLYLAAVTAGIAAARLFDTGGASATARALNLDRHWRNVRTIVSHNPLAYKSYAAGNYAVNGVWPPANGYF